MMQAQKVSRTPATAQSKRESGCLHCGQTLDANATGEFCCTGCRGVYQLLKDSGLSRYYALRGSDKLSPVTSFGTVPRDRMWLEDLISRAGTSPVRKFAIDAQGVQCTACVWLIEALFKREQDAYQCQLNPALGRLALSVGPKFDAQHFVQTVEQFGYQLGPARKNAAQSGLLLRTGVCIALAGNTMFLSATTYLGLSSGPFYELVQQISFAMATLSLVIGGSYFFDRAWQGLMRGVMHLDLPIVVGMGLAYAGSAWSHLMHKAEASYLDTVSVFIALMLVGRVVQERLIERNKKQLLESDGASGLLARRVLEGRTELVSCGALLPGDSLLVCPGEIVPLRAALADAQATCSLDWISGESEPHMFASGDEIPAGAINVGDHAVRVTALAAFERSELDLLLRDDASAKARLAGDFWDKVSRIYVVLVLLVTALGIAGYLLTGHSVTRALEVATAVLVVTCPCAFGIASPLAYELAVSGLRKAGLFVRDASFFDRASQVKRIIFDKTGTLTTGSLQLAKPEVLAELSAEALAVLYALSARSNHPKSTAVARAVERFDPKVRLGSELVREVAGSGVELTRDGTVFRFGSPKWAAKEPLATQGPVLTANGVVLSVLETSEVMRPDAVAEARALTAEGYELWIASGDAQARVSEMAARLGVPAERAFANLDPEGKRVLVDRIDQRDSLFLGDGINDALSLSRAHTSGTPAVDRPFVPARADFYFLSPGLSPVRVALRAGKAVRRVVRHALAFATAYNVFVVGIAYAGLMRPWLAALLMPASSIIVVAFTATALSPRRALWRS